MKKILLLIVLYILTACSANHEKIVSTEKFEKEYEKSKISHSMKSYTILDEKDGYICLLKKEISLYNKSKWDEKQICSKIDELNATVKKELGL